MKKNIITTSQAPSAIGPYSQAVIADGFLFISGQIPLDPQTQTIPESIIAQTHQCMQNIKAILKKAGLSFEHVCKCDIFVTNLDDFQAVNQVYASYLQEPYPARATIEVSRLPMNANIEIVTVAKF